MRKLLCTLIILALVISTITIPGFAQVDSYLYNEVIKLGENIYVTVDYNYELATIAAAVGSNFTHRYYLNFDNQYSRRIKEYFKQYKDLESAKTVWSDICLPESENEFRVIGSRALFSIDLFENQTGIEFVNREYSNPTSKIKNKEDINRVIVDFDQKSKATVFLKKNNDMYKEMFEKYKKEYNFNHLARIRDFFGFDLDNEYFVVNLTLTKLGGDSTSTQSKDGKKVNINNVNIMSNDASSNIMLLYHEAVHNFMHKTLDKHSDKIKEYEKYSTALKKVEWNDFYYSINETLTRAVTAILIESNHNGIDVRGIDNRDSWKNTDNLYKFIKEKYVPNRAKYKTFDDFFPEVLEYIKELYDNPPKATHFGVDLDTVNKYYIFGEREFSTYAMTNVISKITASKPLERGVSGSLYYLEDEYFNGTNLLLFSADNVYSSLPKVIKDKISQLEYQSIKKDEFRVFQFNKAVVLIIKK